jgi:L-ascorbate metabolism protein UlaG (beta-lactamase superfamily)
MIKLTWHGHATWTIESDGTRILIDPFFTDNPAADRAAGDVQADYILISHAHFDHIGDAVDIAKRTGAKVISVFEITSWLEQQGVENVQPLNTGGGINLPFGRVHLTPAEHSSTFADGTPGGVAHGFLIRIGGRTIYDTGDTGLFAGLQMIGERYKPDLALMPIGDVFTMGPDDALEAVRLVKPRVVIPKHYNTWPPIEQDAQAWVERVRGETGVEAVVVKPGESYTLK